VLKKKAQPNLTQAELAKLFGIKKKIRFLPFLKDHQTGWL